MRTDDDRVSFRFQLVDIIQHFVIVAVAQLQLLADSGIPAVDEAGQPEVLLFLTVAFVAGQDNHVLAETVVDGVPDRDGIADTAVDHRDTVDIRHRTKHRKRAGGTTDIDQAVCILLLLEIFGFTRQAIAGDHDEAVRRLEIRLVVERIIFFRINIKKVFVNPVTISLVIGLFLFITGIKLPGVINSTMAGVAALNTPAAMIVLGYYLSCVRIRDLLLNPSLYLASFVRLIIIPLLTLLVLYIIPAGHGQIGMITLIAAATPVGTSTAIFAQKFGQDYERAVCMVCLSTLFSIITMPVVMYLAQMWIM